MRGETFEARRARCAKQDATGEALADARWERGQRLTSDERLALNYASMWGDAGYPLRRLRRSWMLHHVCARGAPLFDTKAQAVAHWETTLAIFRRLAGLEAQERALAQEAALRG